MRDFERLLSTGGAKDAAMIADQLLRAGQIPDIILSSSAMRCRQTADAIYRALGRRPVCRFLDDFYQAAPVTYLEALEDIESENAVMIVGHNPGIEEAFLMLAGHEAFNKACPYGYPTAGVAILDYIATDSAGTAPAQHWKVTDFLAP